MEAGRKRPEGGGTRSAPGGCAVGGRAGGKPPLRRHLQLCSLSVPAVPSGPERCVPKAELGDEGRSVTAATACGAAPFCEGLSVGSLKFIVSSLQRQERR